MSDMLNEVMENFEEEVNAMDENQEVKTEESEEGVSFAGAALVGLAVGCIAYCGYKGGCLAVKGVKKGIKMAKDKYNEKKAQKEQADSVETGKTNEEEIPADFHQVDDKTEETEA